MSEVENLKEIVKDQEATIEHLTRQLAEKAEQVQKLRAVLVQARKKP